MGLITKTLFREGLSTKCWKDGSHKARSLRIKHFKSWEAGYSNTSLKMLSLTVSLSS